MSSKRCSTLSALDGGYSAGGWGEGVALQKEQHRVWKKGTSCVMDDSEWKVRIGNSRHSDSDSPTVPFSSWNMQVKLSGSVSTLNSPEIHSKSLLFCFYMHFEQAIICYRQLQQTCLYMCLKRCWFCNVYPIAMVKAFQYPDHMRFTLLFALQQSGAGTIITVYIYFRHKCPAIPASYVHANTHTHMNSQITWLLAVNTQSHRHPTNFFLDQISSTSPSFTHRKMNNM